MGIPDSLGAFVNAFAAPKPIAKSDFDLDALAREGRAKLWLTEGREDKGTFHPSSLADPCMRFDVVRLILLEAKHCGVLPPPDLRVYSLDADDRDTENFDYSLQRKFDTGTAIHEMEQNKYFGHHPWLIGRWRCSNCGEIVGDRIHKPETCKNVVIVESPKAPMKVTHLPFANRKCQEHGHWIYEEPRVKMGTPAGDLEGRVDMAFRRPGTDASGDLIVDIKTTGSEKFEKLVAAGEPVQKDEIQLKIYLMMWPAETGILRYIDQGAVDTKPFHFVVKRDPMVEESVKRYILQVRDLAAAGRWTVATPVCAKATYARAKRCPLNPLCFKEET